MHRQRVGDRDVKGPVDAFVHEALRDERGGQADGNDERGDHDHRERG